MGKRLRWVRLPTAFNKHDELSGLRMKTALLRSIDYNEEII